MSSIINEKESRNQFIDTVKGILILLVITGHFLQGTLEDNPVRYFIYSFHMPFFFFVSGYLVNVQKLEEESFYTVFKRYFIRILIPWLIAFQIYYALNHSGTGFIILEYLKAYANPYYHLWFAYGYLFCIFLTWFGIHKYKKKVFHFLIALGIFFTVLYICYRASGIESVPVKVIEHSVCPRQLMFFTLGSAVRNKDLTAILYKKGGPIIRWIWFGSISLYFLLLPIGYHHQDFWLEPLIRIILLCIIMIGIRWDEYSEGIFALAWFGTETYPLYLWHVIGKIIGEHTDAYYMVSVLWIVFLIILLRIIHKENPVRLILGR